MGISRYFEDYEIQPDSHGKKRLVYIGEYYSMYFPNGLYRKLKWGFVGSFTLHLVLYLLLSLLPADGARSLWVSIPLLLALFPLGFLGLGMVCFFRAGEQWPKRMVRDIYHRLRWSCLLFIILLLFSISGETASLFRSGSLGWDLLYLAGLLASLVLPLLVLYYQRKYPVKIIVPPESYASYKG